MYSALLQEVVPLNGHRYCWGLMEIVGLVECVCRPYDVVGRHTSVACTDAHASVACTNTHTHAPETNFPRRVVVQARTSLPKSRYFGCTFDGMAETLTCALLRFVMPTAEGEGGEWGGGGGGGF